MAVLDDQVSIGAGGGRVDTEIALASTGGLAPRPLTSQL
jgi:hypothetical protein